jgi:hypothetical protein
MNAASDLPVLIVLRVRGRADAAQVAQATGGPAIEAGAVLARLVTGGLATSAPHGGGTMLTPAGRDALTRLLADEPIDRAALGTQYERFRVVDRELKHAVTAWQLADAAAKASAVAGVMAAATAAGSVAAALAPLAARFAPYAGRIAAAAGAIATGDTRFVASPRVDSLHQVWFELHEDLLVTLGRSRDA